MYYLHIILLCITYVLLSYDNSVSNEHLISFLQVFVLKCCKSYNFFPHLFLVIGIKYRIFYKMDARTLCRYLQSVIFIARIC